MLDNIPGNLSSFFKNRIRVHNICGQILFSVNYFILRLDDINKHQETNTCNSSYSIGPTLGSQYFDYHHSARGKYLPKEKNFFKTIYINLQ